MEPGCLVDQFPEAMSSISHPRIKFCDFDSSATPRHASRVQLSPISLDSAHLKFEPKPRSGGPGPVQCFSFGPLHVKRRTRHTDSGKSPTTSQAAKPMMERRVRWASITRRPPHAEKPTSAEQFGSFAMSRRPSTLNVRRAGGKSNHQRRTPSNFRLSEFQLREGERWHCCGRKSGRPQARTFRKLWDG